MKNLQNKISFSYILYDLFNTEHEFKLVIILAIILISNRDKCQFNSQNLEKVLQENQSDSSNLLLLDHQLL